MGSYASGGFYFGLGCFHHVVGILVELVIPTDTVLSIFVKVVLDKDSFQDFYCICFPNPGHLDPKISA